MLKNHPRFRQQPQIVRRRGGAAALLIMLFSGPAAWGMEPTKLFDAPWIGYDAALYPHITSWASRLADLNGDGIPDLVTTVWYSNPQMTVLLGDGQGRFKPPVAYPLQLGALDVETGDFDKDGDVDLVVAETGQYWEGVFIAYFKNQGDGTFTLAGRFNAGPGPTGLVAADINGDGWLDMAVAHDKYINYGNSIAVLLNNGGNGFQAPLIYSLNSGTHKIAAGDLDGDGDADLVVAHETNMITVLRNGGDGFFDFADAYNAPPGGFGVEPTARVADVDNDGDADILYSHTGAGGFGTGAILLYRNPGDGFFTTPETLPMSGGYGINGAADIAVADVTGDGWPDLLGAAENTNNWSLIVGDGTGGFLTGRELRAGEDPISIKTGDLDGDADLDVVVLGRNSLSANVYLNPGDGALVQPPTIDLIDPSLAPASHSNLAAGDIDNDGDLDFAVGYSANFQDKFGISVRRNNGDGTFAPAENYVTGVLPNVALLRNMNNDGFLDLLWAEDNYPSSRFRLRRNNGNGTFGATINGPSVGLALHTIATCDVDNDGDLDVVAGTGYGEVRVSRNNAGASFAAWQTRVVTAEVSALAFGDFNEDGKADLLANSGVQGWVEICLGNGNGTFQPPVTIETGRGVTAIATADLDGDGHLDFAATYGLDGTGVSACRGRGDGTFFPTANSSGSFSSVYDQTRALTLADVNGDGFPDAMAANYGSQDFSFWPGQEDGAFGALVRYGVGQVGWDLAYGDFDGDGVGDAAVLTEPNSPVNGWYYPAVVLLRGQAAAPPEPADLNCDGAVDFFDIDAFMLALLDPAAYQAAYPGCDPRRGDLNGDGALDFFDIDLFIACVLNGGCP